MFFYSFINFQPFRKRCSNGYWELFYYRSIYRNIFCLTIFFLRKRGFSFFKFIFMWKRVNIVIILWCCGGASICIKYIFSNIHIVKKKREKKSFFIKLELYIFTAVTFGAKILVKNLSISFRPYISWIYSYFDNIIVEEQRPNKIRLEVCECFLVEKTKNLLKIF